ncbi:MAG: hypothetical protein EPN85_13400 [Bacteroidetes bacterium]|nr:MAG: hypothetical protein EPN85_13400 [Bacteroidota bacterium]
MNRILKTSVAEVKLLAHDFLRIEYIPGSRVDLPQLEEGLEAYRQLVGYNRFYLLSVTNQDVTITPRARNYWSTKKRHAVKIAEAFVIKNMGQMLIVNFIMQFQPPGHKVKFFQNEKKAVEWIHSLRGNKNKK